MLRFLRQLFGLGRVGAGDLGERLAADWLRRERGFVVLERNWRSPRDRRDEIDLICSDNAALVFVEVKTRAAGSLVPGYFSVNVRKKRVLRRAATAYLAALKEKPRTFRCDIVEVTLPASGGANQATSTGHATAPQILHFENVPLFTKHFRG